MHTINIITSNETVVFAAGELRKYLRMMMPEDGNYNIKFDTGRGAGIRIGLMQDLGLDVSDVKNTDLDDIIYIDMNENEGIIAGDNPRSVLLAVYDYLRECGCRWLMPGVDGEYIPMKRSIPVKKRFVPTTRYRGWVSEGTVFQQSFREAIDFAPKLGFNVFMIEFKFPKSYYTRYYGHDNNPHRAPEPVSFENMIQWKRDVESEIAKRGLQYHDMGHGFTYEPFGIATEDGWNTEYESQVTPEYREMIAELGGERKILYYPINTNLCMSKEKARRAVAKYAVDYAKRHSNVDYLHIWLADANNNHCECAECVKKRPSDWYVIMLNEIDEAFSEAGLDTKIVFIAYMDTAWAPLEEKIKNPDRFLLMIAPISRKYTETLPNGVRALPAPFVRNKLKMPPTLEDFFALFGEWKKSWHGKSISFEYHFWRAMWLDVSGIEIAKRLHEDVHVYKEYGIDGILEDGSQRCFFPTGFALYTYARAMFDESLTFDEIKEDYFKCAFGEDWEKFYEYLCALEKLFDHKYMCGEKSSDYNVSKFYNPEKVADFERVREVTERGLELIHSHYNSPVRVRTVSTRLLEYHAEYTNILAEAMAYKCVGKDKEADEKIDELMDKMGAHEQKIEMYYDHCLAINALKASIFKFNSNIYMD